METGGRHCYCVMGCLEKRIKADFSSSPPPSSSPEEGGGEAEDEKHHHLLTVAYGISGDSPLPLSSSAVVQVTPLPEYNLSAYFFRKQPKNLNYKCVIGFLVNYLILTFFFTTSFLGLMQLQNSGGGEASASQFILTYIPRSQDRCFSNYMYGNGIAAALFYHYFLQRIEFMSSLVAVLPLHPVTLYYYELH